MTNLEMYALLHSGENSSSSEEEKKLSEVISRTVTQIDIPSEISEIGSSAFFGCEKLKTVTIPANVTIIGTNAFASCVSLDNITIPANVTIIRGYAFRGCISLKTLTLPKSLTSVSANSFADCTNLTNVTLEKNFATNLNLSSSVKYSVETLVNMLNALADRTGQSVYTLTLGNDNLAKLTDEQKAIATEKNWTLA